MNCKNYEPVEVHTGCSGCKSTLPFPECVRSCVDDTTGIRRNWTPAQPEPAAPDSHADLRQHCFECAKFLDCDHYCAPTAGCFVAMEPPAPDISKGVWLRSAWSGHWWPWDSSLECRADVVMVNGEKFVRQGVPDGFCQHSCAYFSLVRRLAACLRGGKWSDFVKITNEAKRISPETKGE